MEGAGSASRTKITTIGLVEEKRGGGGYPKKTPDNNPFHKITSKTPQKSLQYMTKSDLVTGKPVHKPRANIIFNIRLSPRVRFGGYR